MSPFAEELQRLEARLNREYDRRFSEVDKQMSSITKAIENLDGKIDSINDKREEDNQWKVRYLLGLLSSFLVGGLSSALLEYAINHH